MNQIERIRAVAKCRQPVDCPRNFGSRQPGRSKRRQQPFAGERFDKFTRRNPVRHRAAHIRGPQTVVGEKRRIAQPIDGQRRHDREQVAFTSRSRNAH